MHKPFVKYLNSLRPTKQGIIAVLTCLFIIPIVTDLFMIPLTIGSKLESTNMSIMLVNGYIRLFPYYIGFLLCYFIVLLILNKIFGYAE
jgi:hypothetical protein